MSITNYKCPNCTGPVKFNAEKQSLQCDYCLSTFQEQDFSTTDSTVINKETENNVEQMAMMQQYHCKQCGAEVIHTSETIATFCSYCHNPTIIHQTIKEEVKPHFVIPFKIDKTKAVEMFLAWTKKQKFAPKDFGSSKHYEKLTGMYVPFWLFDIENDFSYQYTAENHRSYRRGDYIFKEVDEYEIHRAGNIGFKRIPADGSSQMADEIMEAIEPYNFDELQVFDPTYLSGFFADKFDVNADAVYERIKTRAKEYTEKEIKHSISGYDYLSGHATRYDLNKSNTEYALLPIWFLTYPYKNEQYYFAINAQSGKIVGKTPVEQKRVALHFLVIFAITFILATLFTVGMVLVALIVALLIAGFTTFSQVNNRNNKITTTATTYLHGATNYRVKKDTFIRTRETSTYSPQTEQRSSSSASSSPFSSSSSSTSRSRFGASRPTSTKKASSNTTSQGASRQSSVNRGPSKLPQGERSGRKGR